MTFAFIDHILALVLATVVIFYVARNRHTSSKRHLPPGPRPLPILGNAHQMSFEYPEKLFAQWGDVYGDLIFIRMFSTPVLVVNSAKAARDLMEKRSNKYSDRPRAVRMVDLLGWDGNFGFMNYGEKFRKGRRWIQGPFFDKATLAQLLPVQALGVHALLFNLLRDPDNFVDHFRRFSGALMMETLYGHSVESSDDEYMQLYDKVIDGVTGPATPGAALVDFFPFLDAYSGLATWRWMETLGSRDERDLEEYPRQDMGTGGG